MTTGEVEIIAGLPAKTTELEREGGAIVARIRALEVTDDASYLEAVEAAKYCRRGLMAVAEVMDPICDAAHKTWRVATERRKALQAPFEQGKKLADDKAGVYHEAQERARKEAEEAARREQERREAEARAQLEAEQARLQRQAEDRALEAAAAAEAQGDRAMAERILAAPVEVPVATPAPVFTPPVVAAPAAPRTDGYGFRTAHKAELVSMADLVRAAAGGNTAALSLLSFNQSAADGIARSTRGTLTIPGVRFTQVKVAAGRV
jgi:hypothetical protein